MNNRDDRHRLMEWHRKQAIQYAERSHEFEGSISDGYSALSEAHQQTARAFADSIGLLIAYDASERNAQRKRTSDLTS